MLCYFSLRRIRRHLKSSCYSMKLSPIIRCVYWAGVPTAGSFSRYGHHNKKKKQRNQTIEFSWGFYCLVVLFLLVYVICASINTEGTVKQGLTILQKFKIKTWVKSTCDTILSVFFSYLQDVRFQRSAMHMCRTPKWQHCGVFLW